VPQKIPEIICPDCYSIANFDNKKRWFYCPKCNKYIDSVTVNNQLQALRKGMMDKQTQPNLSIKKLAVIAVPVFVVLLIIIAVLAGGSSSPPPASGGTTIDTNELSDISEGEDTNEIIPEETEIEANESLNVTNESTGTVEAVGTVVNFAMYSFSCGANSTVVLLNNGLSVIRPNVTYNENLTNHFPEELLNTSNYRLDVHFQSKTNSSYSFTLSDYLKKTVQSGSKVTLNAFNLSHTTVELDEYYYNISFEDEFTNITSLLYSDVCNITSETSMFSRGDKSVSLESVNCSNKMILFLKNNAASAVLPVNYSINDSALPRDYSEIITSLNYNESGVYVEMQTTTTPLPVIPFNSTLNVSVKTLTGEPAGRVYNYLIKVYHDYPAYPRWIFRGNCTKE